MNWHEAGITEVLKELGVSATDGLSEEEALHRVTRYGKNKIAETKEKTVWQILLSQFLSPVIYLLIGAAVISFVLKDINEGIAIIIVIFINAAIGFYMEWQAVTSMRALKTFDIIEAKVLRNGKMALISSDAVTIGDIIILEAGNMVPADARVLEAKQFQVDESALTGESLPVAIQTDALPGATFLADQTNMLFKGTMAVKGTAKAVVVNIGMQSELGKISEMVQQADQTATPLEKKLEMLTKKLIGLTIFIALAFFITGWLKGYALLPMLQTTIAMAVAAIPEGLPIVATIALAYGMLKMAQKNVIVKHLAAVETLGSANIILTDKTGTLTENKISTTNVIIAPINDTAIQDDNPVMEKIFFISVLCNDATIDGQKEMGDPLELALLQWAKEKHYDIEKIRKDYVRVDEEAFTSESKFMATLHRHNDCFYSCVKGATEVVLKNCCSFLHNNKILLLDEKSVAQWQASADELSANGTRVLALAYNEMNDAASFRQPGQWIFTALIGFSDPPNKEVHKAIDKCRQAGIKVVMLTGDHPATAYHIAKEINLATDKKYVVNGNDLTSFNKDDSETKQHLLQANVFARVTPRQKLDIVKFYQDNGFIAAMTGDGVNDAPALKKADIGIAMGMRGTQIAKETADLVLKDDSFNSIVSAVQHGRIIFENIRKCILFLLSCNLSEIMVITVAAFLSVSSPLSPLQILYLNLVTDVFPALALAVSRGNADIMKTPPRNPKEGFLVLRDWQAIITYSIIITLSVFTAFMYCRDYLQWDVLLCNNVIFLSLALAQLWHVFNLPSANVSFFKNEITGNKYMWAALVFCIVIMMSTYFIIPARKVLLVQELDMQHVIVIIIASLLPVFFIQLFKRLKMIE